MKVYKYFTFIPSSSVVWLDEDTRPCPICGRGPEPGQYGYHYIAPDGERVRVAVCYHHQEQVQAIEEPRHWAELKYQIESGWPENPIWYCRIVVTEEPQQIGHLHTTPAAGSAPSVWSGEEQLFFLTGTGCWPCTSREGHFVVEEYHDSETPVRKKISREEALRLALEKGTRWTIQ